MITVLQTIQDLQLRCMGRAEETRFTITTIEGGKSFKATIERYGSIPKTVWFYESDNTIQWGEKIADIEQFINI